MINKVTPNIIEERTKHFLEYISVSVASIEVSFNLIAKLSVFMQIIANVFGSK